jgi:N6-L-threonylcarbamoyladenine synthase
MSEIIRILAIESSCDETAVAILDSNKNILGHKVITQLEEHQPYGGVVPEIAARSHINYLDKLVAETMKDAGLGFNDIDAVAATSGPGLIGGVIVGVMVAKAIASSANIPFLAINHLEGHALTVRLTEDIDFPFLLLLVSGGHCQFLSVSELGKYKRLGTTLDDALGEAYDKVAKMLGLDYPGGPVVEKYALGGDEQRSFSGLKTAVKRTVDSLVTPVSEQDKADICASFQYTVGKVITSRISNAIEMYRAAGHGGGSFVLAGGVAANQYLRFVISDILTEHGFKLYVPPINLCTDNAAMIGWAAMERFQQGYTSPLDFSPKARWSLEEV